jgi:uncharacterized membrane protein YgcG
MSIFSKSLAVALAFVAATAFAEATFPQVENMIDNKQYEVASLALQEIIANHPNSAKAFYAMAQTQAGLGNLPKAQFALNKAKALDPELKFASSGNIASLEQAITPQTAKIEKVEESHFARNLILILFALALAFVIYYFFIRKPDQADDEYRAKHVPPKPMPPAPEDKVTAVNSQPLNTATTYQGTSTPHTYTSNPAPVASTPSTTVINNHYGSNNDGFVTGMLVGEMMTSHPRETVIVEQPVYVAPSYTPSYTAPARDTSWDNDSSSSSSSRSSSWDSDDSSSKSSSWSSSSSSDSSWSSSSDSSSSWDSGSSSSDSGSSDW